MKLFLSQVIFTIGYLVSIYILCLVLLTWMGRRAFRGIKIIDIIPLIMLGTLAAHPIKYKQPVLAGMTIIVLAFVHTVFSRLNLFNWFHHFDDPVYLMKHGKIIRENLKLSRITVIELLSLIRQRGYADISKIDTILMENTGHLSIFPKTSRLPLTDQTSDISVKPFELPKILIVDGKIRASTLEDLGRDEKWLVSNISNKGFHSVSDVTLATIDTDGNMYIT